MTTNGLAKVKALLRAKGGPMSDWHQLYEAAAEEQAERFARFSDRQLLDAIRRRATGDCYVRWYEVAKRKPPPETCWLFYEVLLSDRPYLDKYHCAAALLRLLDCTEFEEVELSADWPVVPGNLAQLRRIIHRFQQEAVMKVTSKARVTF